MNFESLRNKFEKLREEWAEDSHVDFQFKNKQYSADLAQVALDIPFCHNKYLNHYTDISQIKTSLEFEIRKLIREKRDSIYPHFNLFLFTTWRHICQF